MYSQTSPLSNPRVRNLFEKALHLPAAARPTFITKEARGDTEVESQVLSLLQSAEERLRQSFGVNPNEGSSLHGTATFELLQKLAVAPPLDSVRYKTEGQLGRGGMGAVMSVRDEYLNRQLAMKVMLDLGRPDDPIARQMAHQMLGRFLEEAQVTSQLDHPGVVPVHELGIDAAGKVYFTMRLVKGQTLKDVFEKVASGAEGWDRARALEAMLKVCDTMAYSHDKDVLHRDLKPANVMVGRFGEVYVMDWGLAKVLGHEDRHDLRIKEEAKTGDEEVTVSSRTLLHTARKEDIDTVAGGSIVSMDGQQLGTPTYMAPEQARSEPLDARADIYSLGAMLYTLLAGRPPYVTPGVPLAGYRVLEKLVAGPPEPLTSIAKDVPAALVAIVERAMARNKVSRYQKVQDLAADLRAYLDGRVVQAYQTGAIAEMKLWVRRNKPLALSMASAAVFLVVGLVVSIWSWKTAAAAFGSERVAKEDAVRATRVAEAAQADAVKQTKAAELATIEAKEQRGKADDNAKQLAEKVQEQKQTLEKFEQTKSVVDFTRVMADADGLFVPRSEREGKIEDWLARAGQVLGKGADFEREVQQLEQRAKREDELSEDGRRARQRTAEAIVQQLGVCTRLEAELAELRRVDAVRRGQATFREPNLPPDLERPGDEQEMQAWSINLVRTVRSFATQLEGRYVLDGEVMTDSGAAFAASKQLLGITKQYKDPKLVEPRFLAWHAWALAANGLDTTALRELDRARLQANQWNDSQRADALAKQAREAIEAAVRTLPTWIELAPRRLADVESALRSARARMRDLERQQLVFGDDADGKLTAFLCGEMRRFLARLPDLETRVEEVRQDLDWARQIARANERRPTGWRPWENVREDLRANPRYRGQSIEFGSAVRAELVPIDKNPHTGLWEFYDLRSAWDGRCPIDQIVIPNHDKATGNIAVAGATGIVFVLLPAGEIQLSGTADESANRESVKVPPFLIARHELTQGQWARLWRRGHDGRYPSAHPAGKWVGSEVTTCANPVENVDLAQATALLDDNGMKLPNEAEWVYACTAGTLARFAFTEEQLAQACNDNGGGKDRERAHRPAGSLIGNRFGMHAMHGNVAEMIAGDPPQHAGGSFSQPLDDCTSSSIFLFEAGSRRSDVGLRAMRRVED
ncbi:MAG: protein kinase [Planctomycetota bacterium]